VTNTNSKSTSLEPHMPGRNLAWQALVGFLFGYFVLHPVSMMIFHWLDPRIAVVVHRDSGFGLLAPVVHSFHLNMLPMGLIFGLVGTSITVFYGYHRLMLTAEKHRLAEQLRRNERLRAELVEQAEQLRRSNEELARLESANRRATRFMAHDFKTALNCVGGFATELLERPDLPEDSEVAAALACIRRQAHRMMGSVTDLLELARAREGGLPKMQPVSAAGLLEEAAGDFSLPARAENVSLGEQCRRCPTFQGDPRLLRRVLCNLIANAVEHNDHSVHVWLDAEVDETAQAIRFSCRDDGSGIAPEILPSIFTEFVTTGCCGSTSTGLGLAFCKTVVEAHGGRIWCDNLDQGAQFLFTIPLNKENNHVK
jgi:signal transduction histidine kinase